MRRLATAVAASMIAIAAATPADAAAWQNPGDIVVSPDGRHAYAGGSTLVAFSRDQESGRLTEIGQTNFSADQLAVSPDGRFVYAAEPGLIHVIARDPATGKLLHSHSVTGGPELGISLGQIRDLAVAPDGAKLYLAQRRENAFVALRRDPATGALARGQAFFADTDPLPYNPHIAVSPDGRDVYLAGALLVHFHADAPGGELTRASTNLEPIDGVVVSRDGSRVYAAEGDSGRIVFARDGGTGALTKLPGGYVRPGGGCSGCWPTTPLAVGPAGTLFAARGEAGEVQSFDASGDQLVLQRTLGGIADLRRIADLTAAPDGRSVYATGGHGTPGTTGPTRPTAGAIAAIQAGGGALDTIQTLTPGPGFGVPPRTPGVTIGDGAIYVNSQDVKVKVGMPWWRPAAFEISNDGGFANAKRMAFEPDGEYDWRLPAGTTPARMVKRVYVRFVPNGKPDHEFPASSSVMDDVILDTRAPQLVSARVSGKRLVLRARDDRSGVRQVQVTTNKRKPGSARKFRSRLTAPRGRSAVYVRVLDAAGNRSGWKRAAR